MIVEAEADSQARHRAYWLAARGAQQMDLALRFAAAAHSRGLRVLALKGISIASELYGGVENRPMADVDFLVVDTPQFGAVVDLARSLEMEEIGASDHALVFKEASSGVVLELHVSLTACPGLFPVDHDALWQRRAEVAGTSMQRLSNEDLVVHLALHTAFQHAFAANTYHYGDFERAWSALHVDLDRVLTSASECGALEALSAMALASARVGHDAPCLSRLLSEVRTHCPAALARWLESRPRMPPPVSISSLAFVRYQLAPSKWGYLTKTLLPKTIPGRTLTSSGTWTRLSRLVSAALTSPAREHRPPR